MSPEQKYIVEKPGRIPVLGNYDVAVAGAGTAGIAAALAAAREGAKVCLIEKRTMAGGLATSGLVAFYLPLCDGMGHQMVGGIAEDLIKLSVKYGPGEIPPQWKKKASVAKRAQKRYMLKFNPHSFALAIDELLAKSGVEIFYDTLFCDCVMRGKSIKALAVENKGGRGAVLAGAVVDASGDADVCDKAGEKTHALDSNIVSSWYYLFKDGEVILRPLGGSYRRKMKPFEKTYSGVDSHDVTEHAVKSRAMALKDIKAECSDYSSEYPVTLPSMPQFRMTRRLVGAFELDKSQERVCFDDAVCMAGDWRQPGPIYYIPLRCLFGKVENLLAAGRCISVTEEMWDVTRAIPVCAATGEAAGTAAALSVLGKEPVQKLDAGRLKERLVKHGAILDNRFAG